MGLSAGSTVVMLAGGRHQLQSKAWQPAAAIRMGEAMGLRAS